jgi:hypothetical protein
MVAYLLLVVAMIFDWRTRGRPHRVYVFGGAALVAVKLLTLTLVNFTGWSFRLSNRESILAQRSVCRKIDNVRWPVPDLVDTQLS